MELLLLKEWAEAQGIALTNEQLSQFEAYADNLLLWNEKMNLTAITDSEMIQVKHFIDSLTVLPWLPPNTSLIDIGTGAGFPGLPLKILKPDIQLTLMDSLRKRILFLQNTVDLLGLKDVLCIHSRVEDWQKEKKEYPIVTARAVARLDKLAGYALPLVMKGGLFLALKGPEVEEEFRQARPIITKLGGKLVEIKKAAISADIVHSIVVIEKYK